jgi:hypothetical protein
MTPRPSSVHPFTSVLGPSIASSLQLKEALGRQFAAERAILRALDTFLTMAQADLTADTFARGMPPWRGSCRLCIAIVGLHRD